MTHKDFSEKTCAKCKLQGPKFNFGMFVCDNPKSKHYQHILFVGHHICMHFEKEEEDEN